MYLEGELRRFEEPNGRDAELKDLKDEQALTPLGVKATGGTGARWGRRNGGGMGLSEREREREEWTRARKTRLDAYFSRNVYFGL